MKYKTKFLIFVSIIAVVSSCKKKKTETTETTQTPANTTIINTPIANGLPSNVNAINGVFVAQKIIPTSNAFIAYQSLASFNTNGKTLQSLNPKDVTLVGQDNAGALKINNTTLYFETNAMFQNYIYSDNSSSPNYSAGVNWNLNATGLFSSFTASISHGFPSVSSTTFVPISFSKSNGFTLNFGTSNITNADSIIVQISGNSFNISKTLPATATSVTFNSSDLSTTYVGMQNAAIDVYAKNYSNMVVNNKTYVFIMLTMVTGAVDITP